MRITLSLDGNSSTSQCAKRKKTNTKKKPKTKMKQKRKRAKEKPNLNIACNLSNCGASSMILFIYLFFFCIYRIECLLSAYVHASAGTDAHTLVGKLPSIVVDVVNELNLCLRSRFVEHFQISPGASLCGTRNCIYQLIY